MRPKGPHVRVRIYRLGFGARVACALAIGGLGLVLILAPVAGATAASFTWSGAAASSSPGWSSGANWVSAVAPSPSESLELKFPRLTSGACTSELSSHTCYTAKNDITGLAVSSLRVNDSEDYKMTGDEIVLSGGLVATPEGGAGGPAGDVIGLPIELGYSSVGWAVEGGGGNLGENGVLLTGDVTGANKDLTFDIYQGPGIYLRDNIETEFLAFDGSVPGALNGLVDLQGAMLNASDGGAVQLGNVLMMGSGTIGVLLVNDAALSVGNDSYPTGDIKTGNVTLEADSKVAFAISGDNAVAGTDYSQLTSGGTIRLGNSSVQALIVPDADDICPELVLGRTYTFVATTGNLSGSFGNAPEGAEIPITYAEGCPQQPFMHLRITYHESGETQTVTGTVTSSIPVFTDPQSAWVTETAGHGSAEEIAAFEKAQKAREEAERLALAAKEKAKRVASETSLASSNIAVSGGMALVKLKCAGAAACAGKLTLTTSKTLKNKHSHTILIGTASFSITADGTTTAKIKLSATGRALLGADHGHLNAHLTIAETTPTPVATLTKSVHLLQLKTHGGRKR